MPTCMVYWLVSLFCFAIGTAVVQLSCHCCAAGAVDDPPAALVHLRHVRPAAADRGGQADLRGACSPGGGDPSPTSCHAFLLHPSYCFECSLAMLLTGLAVVRVPQLLPVRPQVKHFERCHMPCPEHFNPADFFLVTEHIMTEHM